MPRKKKDTPDTGSGGGSASGSSKRPSRTIDLEAEEVEAKPDESAADAEDEAPDDTDGSEDSGDVTEEPDRADDEPVRPTAAEAPGGRRVRPPQRTTPSEIKSFVTHLAAGLVGGLIGVVGAGLSLDRLPLSGLMGDRAAPEKLVQIEQRLKALDDQLAGQTKAIERATSPEVLEKLESRLTTIEQRPDPAAAGLEDLQGRLTKLEATLNTLQETAGQEGASGLAEAVALTGRIETLSADLERRAAALEKDMAQLKATLETHTESQAADANATKLSERLDKLEEEIAALAARPPAAPEPAAALPGLSRNGAALALAFESLRRAVDRGDVFSAQLETLRKLAPDGLDLSGLSSHAAAGAPTERALLRALPEILREARAAAAKADDDSFLGRLVSNAQSVVRVRRIGPKEGESTGAVLSRIEAQMKAASLAGVLREAKGLSGPALEVLQPWLKKADARQAINTKLETLERSLLADLEPGAQR